MKTAQNTYQFTLVLKNVDEKAPNLEDSLFEAGCDDALIHFRNGTVYLDFDRKAASLEDAVLSAVKCVESASIKAIVANVAPENLVTESEVAKRLDMTRQSISLWIAGTRRKDKPFPNPVMKLTEKSPLRRWDEIVVWLYQNQLIDQKELVENAVFLRNLNAVLEERDITIRKSRQSLLKKIDLLHSSHQPRPPH